MSHKHQWKRVRKADRPICCTWGWSVGDVRGSWCQSMDTKWICEAPGCHRTSPDARCEKHLPKKAKAIK